MNKSLYETLGVDKSATQAEIKSAYKKLAIKLHPDKNNCETTAEFQAITHAYEILSDDARRANYDETGNTELNDQDADDISELCMMMQQIIANIDVDHADIIEKMRSQISETQFTLSRTKTLINNNIDKLNKVIKRLQVKDGLTNFLADSLNGSITAQQRLLVDVDVQSAKLVRMLALLGSFNYDYVKRPDLSSSYPEFILSRNFCI